MVTKTERQVLHEEIIFANHLVKDLYPKHIRKPQWLIRKKIFKCENCFNSTFIKKCHKGKQNHKQCSYLISE